MSATCLDPLTKSEHWSDFKKQTQIVVKYSDKLYVAKLVDHEGKSTGALNIPHAISICSACVFDSDDGYDYTDSLGFLLNRCFEGVSIYKNDDGYMLIVHVGS